MDQLSEPGQAGSNSQVTTASGDGRIALPLGMTNDQYLGALQAINDWDRLGEEYSELAIKLFEVFQSDYKFVS